MKNLTEDIKKKSCQRVYLFYGEEEYLKQQYKQKMKEVLLPEGDTMNLTVYEGKSADPQEIMAQAETMPFFAAYRLILVRTAGFSKAAAVIWRSMYPGFPRRRCWYLLKKKWISAAGSTRR